MTSLLGVHSDSDPYAFDRRALFSKICGSSGMCPPPKQARVERFRGSESYLVPTYSSRPKLADEETHVFRNDSCAEEKALVSTMHQFTRVNKVRIP